MAIEYAWWMAFGYGTRMKKGIDGLIVMVVSCRGSNFGSPYCAFSVSSSPATSPSRSSRSSSSFSVVSSSGVSASMYGSGGFRGVLGYPVFVKAPESCRKSDKAAMPFLVPSMVGIWMSRDAARSTCRCAEYLLHSRRICSRVWYGSPHGQSMFSDGTNLL